MKKTQIGESQLLEDKAANILLEEGVKFEIKGLGKFRIKPLTLYTLIKINKDALHVKEIDDKGSIASVIGYAENAEPISRMVSKAILRSPIKIKIFGRLFAYLLRTKLTSKELSDLLTAVVSQSGADFFFVCTKMASQMRIMKPKDTKGTTVSTAG